MSHVVKSIESDFHCLYNLNIIFKSFDVTFIYVTLYHFSVHRLSMLYDLCFCNHHITVNKHLIFLLEKHTASFLLNSII